MTITKQLCPSLDLDSTPRGSAVLVAEDSDNDFVLLSESFRLAGLEPQHQLIRVRTGDAAIVYLKGETPFDDRQRWPFPDLLLLDAKMPNGSGFDVLRFLADHQKKTQIEVPAVVLSGSCAPKDLYESLELGAAEFISKPSDMSELLLMVQTIHHRWLRRTGPRGRAESLTGPSAAVDHMTSSKPCECAIRSRYS